jgi:hypothetical protein
MNHRGSPRYRVASHVAARRLDEATIVAELRDGTYFELDAVGSLIWQEIAAGANLDHLVGSVTAAFEIDEATARVDLEAFLADLVERGLVESVVV